MCLNINSEERSMFKDSIAESFNYSVTCNRGLYSHVNFMKRTCPARGLVTVTSTCYCSMYWYAHFYYCHALSLKIHFWLLHSGLPPLETFYTALIAYTQCYNESFPEKRSRYTDTLQSVSNAGGVEIFRPRVDSHWSPPRLLCNVYRVSFAGLHRRGNDVRGCW